MFDAEGVVDFAEDDYLRDLATALGMDEDEYSDLVIEYYIEEPSQAAQVLVRRLLMAHASMRRTRTARAAPATGHSRPAHARARGSGDCGFDSR